MWRLEAPPTFSKIKVTLLPRRVNCVDGVVADRVGAIVAHCLRNFDGDAGAAARPADHFEPCFLTEQNM